MNLPQLQGITTHLAGTYCGYPQRDGLSWPGWPIKYRAKCSAPRIEHKHDHPSKY